jgi:hypothetical protein
MEKTLAESNTVKKRRMSWAELYKLRPDLRPANDNRGADCDPGRLASVPASQETFRIRKIGNSDRLQSTVAEA